MDRNVMIQRLEWFANEGYDNETPHWLAPNVWPRACRAGLCRARWIP
ncbi:hypothetical protein ABIB73_000275 [Bradyrhizobium sp. F1.4.3]